MHNGSKPLPVISDDEQSLDLTECDREPIHLAGSIQPHGFMLIADAASLKEVAGAGQIEARCGDDWLGQPLAALLGQPLDRAMQQMKALAGTSAMLTAVTLAGETFDIGLHLSGDYVIAELEPRPDIAASAAATLSRLDVIGTAFERAPDLTALCERAAAAFRELTGFDRVMIYRFLDDDSGVVLAEDRDPALQTFLNHHFPASDIPKQARALYVRNRVRVIPDVNYVPAPIRPAAAGLEQLDLSDSALRSVSPIHVQYLRNMDVGASASVSIVKDGLLWGLVACHNRTPRRISQEMRVACQALAGGLSRQIRSKEEAAAYRERIRLRSAEEELIGRLDRRNPRADWFADERAAFTALLDAHGFAVVRGGQAMIAGICPDEQDVLDLAAWLAARMKAEPFVTAELATLYAPAQAFRDKASGIFAMNMPSEAAMLIWCRVEQPETVEWAGNPHKAVQHRGAALTPRASFHAWREEVRGRSRRWTAGQIEAAGHLRRTLADLRQGQRLRELNHQLQITVSEKEALLAEKDHLMREVNHRVQNSIQLVQSFLALQSHASNNLEVADQLQEAQRRLSAVALVHRRLYQADQVEMVDLSRYVEDLVSDLGEALGEAWRQAIRLDAAPVLLSADRAVHVGLIMTELVINANKYAYGGSPGPLAISVDEHRDRFRLTVADHGTGVVRDRVGFGTRMMNAMVKRLSGTLEQFDNQPGLRVVLTAPLDPRSDRAAERA